MKLFFLIAKTENQEELIILMNNFFNNGGNLDRFSQYEYREKQIDSLKMLLKCSTELAINLYSNGVLVSPLLMQDLISFDFSIDKLVSERKSKLMPGSNYSYFPLFQDENPILLGPHGEPILLDSWYYRAVCWPTRDQILKYYMKEKDPEFFIPTRPPTNLRTGISTRIRDELITYSLKKGLQVERMSFLDSNLPIFFCRTKEELNKVIEVQNKFLTISGGRPTLWFRGQNKEYPFVRDKDVNKWLQYPDSASHNISLEPSLIRTILNNYNQDFTNNIMNELLSWEKAFVIWVYKQKRSWFIPSEEKPLKPEIIKYLDQVYNGLDKILSSSDYGDFADLMQLIRRSPFFDSADDFRQWLPDYLSSSLLMILQHYGMPTFGLDVTKDLEVALFFALNKYNNKNYAYQKLENINDRNCPIIYVFLPKSGIYRGPENVDSEQFFKKETGEYEFTIPLRIRRQKCGLLRGVGSIGRNYYTDFILSKIILKNFDDVSERDQSYLFPSAEEDLLFDLLMRTKPDLRFLTKFK